MDIGQITKFQAWFDCYVNGFYGSDEYINANIKLKEEHSRRVCEEMDYLAGKLKLSEQQRFLAVAIGLFHDIGRFEQFAKYQTYKDATSINHASFGTEVLRNEKILEETSEKERNIIETAIELHNIKELPAELDGDELLLSKMIRDADKLDIFYLIEQLAIQYQQDRENFTIELELPDTPVCSKEVINKVKTGQRIDYKELKSLNDMKLCQLSWIYDVNFPATLERIESRKFLDTIIASLPQSEQIASAAAAVKKYIRKRLAVTD